MENLAESAIRRAWRDTEDFRNSFWFFWLWEVLGAGFCAAASAVFLLPDDPDTSASVAYPVGGVVVGALISYFAVYLLNLALAPMRQRNEARLFIARIPGSPESPITPQVSLFIRHDDNDRQIGAAKLARADADLRAETVLELPIHLSANNDVLVEQMELDVAGRRATSSWKSDWVAVGAPTIGSVRFAIPEDINPGEHEVKIVAYADGKWWASNSFSATVPEIQLPSATDKPAGSENSS